MRDLDRTRGAVVIVRPDQDISQLLSRDDVEAFDEYFAKYLKQAD